MASLSLFASLCIVWVYREIHCVVCYDIFPILLLKKARVSRYEACVLSFCCHRSRQQQAAWCIYMQRWLPFLFLPHCNALCSVAWYVSYSVTNKGNGEQTWSMFACFLSFCCHRSWQQQAAWCIYMQIWFPFLFLPSNSSIIPLLSL